MVLIVANRTEILLDLLRFSKTIEELKLDLSSLPWDYDGVPIIFFRSHLLNVLVRFLNTEIDTVEVESWANLVECREDIDFEKNHSDELSQMVYQLANPELEGELDSKKCKEMIKALKFSLHADTCF